MMFLRYQQNGIYEFPKKAKNEFVAAKFLFFGLCKHIQDELKHGFIFKEDNATRVMYKKLQKINSK